MNLFERGGTSGGRWLHAGVIVLAVFLVVTALTPFGAAKSPDSFRYLDVSENIRHGRGIVVARAMLERPALAPDREYVPFAT